jgi:undecaprenyl-diphosphatase
MLPGILVIAGALLVFFMLAAEVARGGTPQFDKAILLLFRDAQGQPLGPAWFQETMRDITSLGSNGVLVLFTFFVAIFLWLDAKRATAFMVIVCVLGGILIVNFLKLVFYRPRPDMVEQGALVFTSSFPSSHAMMAAIVCLSLGHFLAGRQKRVALKIYVYVLALILTALIGVSRIYLGLHWPSDVAAGWAIGTAWASLCCLVMQAIQRRSKIEPEQTNL